MKKPKAEVRPLVLVVTQDGETREYEFKQASVILGSGPTANVLLSGDEVSTIHAIIKLTMEQATLIDLGSDAGTRRRGVTGLRRHQGCRKPHGLFAGPHRAPRTDAAQT